MMDAEIEGSNPKLQQVKYVNVLPEGKLGDYTQNNRVDFMPDPITAPYFDGAQSYINIRVRNTSTFDQGNSGSSADAVPPLCFPAHIGANALINRMVVRAKENNMVIEDLEAYNMVTGIQQSYSHDSDVFPTLSRITGVAGRTCEPMNQTVDNLGVNYFLPNGELNASSNTITGGGEAVNATFCLPVNSGLFSAFGFMKDSFGNLAKQHHVVPNLDVGGVHVQMFLEKNNVALQTMYSRFYKAVVVNGSNCVEEVGKNPFDDHASVKAGTQILINEAECDTSLTVNDVAYDPSMCVFRVGQLVTDGTDTRKIVSVKTNQGTGKQIEIEVDVAFSAGDGPINIKLANVTRSYVIDKIELKLLLTIPDDSTVRMIRSQMARGISFTSLQLYKQSTASQLKNAVIDIPEALTRAQAIVAVPCQQDDLEALDINNSYVYCRPDALLPVGGNTNQVSYQWQIENQLLPNLAVDTDSKTNAQSDNSIFFNQQVMALRHLIEVKALADSPKVRKSQDVDLELPFFLPVSLSPRGVSYDLVNSAPQLRITNSANGADIKAKLYHIFVIHTRILSASDAGVQVQF